MVYKGKIRADRTRKIHSLKEYPSFQMEIEKLQGLCNLIQKEKSKEKEQALKNYVIMRLIAVSENLLKSMTAYFIDEFKIHASQIISGGDLPLELDELDEIKGKDITKGKIMATTFGLSNARKINNTFGKITNIQDQKKSGKKKSTAFFDWIQELSGFKKEERNLFRETNELLNIRNEITHEMDDYSGSGEELGEKITVWSGLINMMWYASFFHLSRKRKTSKKLNAAACEELFDMSIDEFYNITRKHSPK